MENAREKETRRQRHKVKARKMERENESDGNTIEQELHTNVSR